MKVEYSTMAEYGRNSGVEMVIHMRMHDMQYLSIGLGDQIPFDVGGDEKADTVYRGLRVRVVLTSGHGKPTRRCGETRISFRRCW